MTNFNDKSNNDFVASECTQCLCIVWPPSEYCNNCFSKTNSKMISKIGKLLEFSKDGNNFFGIVEFDEQIRVTGIIKTEQSNLEVGQSIKLIKFDKKNSHRFEFST